MTSCTDEVAIAAAEKEVLEDFSGLIFFISGCWDAGMFVVPAWRGFIDILVLLLNVAKKKTIM